MDYYHQHFTIQYKLNCFLHNTYNYTATMFIYFKKNTQKISKNNLGLPPMLNQQRPEGT